MKAICLSIACVTLLAVNAPAAIVTFTVTGPAGNGLLPGNEPSTTGNPGTGGIGPGGITYDTDTNVLAMDIRWGSANGFVNLSGDASAGHVHGGAGSNASSTTGFGVLHGFSTLPGWNASASAGGFIGNVTFTDANELLLLNGNTYVNIHTAANTGGEIRGQLVAVPEPTCLAMLSMLTGTAMIYRRRRA